jgi:hypothetical protein
MLSVYCVYTPFAAVPRWRTYALVNSVVARTPPGRTYGEWLPAQIEALEGTLNYWEFPLPAEPHTTSLPKTKST